MTGYESMMEYKSYLGTVDIDGDEFYCIATTSTSAVYTISAASLLDAAEQEI